MSDETVNDQVDGVPEEPKPQDDDAAYRAEAQRKVNQDLERKLKDALARLDRMGQVEADLAKLQGKEAEYAEAQKAREVEAAALAKANERIVRAEVRAAAAGKLADPSDALRYLDVSKFAVDDDGAVDEAAVAAAIAELVERKPYLAAQGGRLVTGSADGGARKESTPGQLTKADLERMSAARQYDEIEKARQEGRLNQILGIKP